MFLVTYQRQYFTSIDVLFIITPYMFHWVTLTRNPTYSSHSPNTSLYLHLYNSFVLNSDINQDIAFLLPICNTLHNHSSLYTHFYNQVQYYPFKMRNFCTKCDISLLKSNVHIANAWFHCIMYT